MILGQFQDILMLGLGLLVLALAAWALVDCLRRPANLFPYIERKSKTLWVILTAVAAAVAVVLVFNPLNIFGIASIVVSLVYLFDLRPKFEQVSARRH